VNPLQIWVARVTLLDRLNDSTGERGRLGAVARVTLLDRLEPESSRRSVPPELRG